MGIGKKQKIDFLWIGKINFNIYLMSQVYQSQISRNFLILNKILLTSIKMFLRHKNSQQSQESFKKISFYDEFYYLENDRQKKSMKKLHQEKADFIDKCYYSRQNPSNRKFGTTKIVKGKIRLFLSIITLILLVGHFIHYYDVHKVQRIFKFVKQENLPKLPHSTLQLLPNQQSQLIQWPLERLHYHIYPKANTKIVLEVVKKLCGQYHLSLYDWDDMKSQQFYFERVKGNSYHIISAQSGYFMRKSEKKRAGQNMIEFSSEEGSLWELVPVSKTAPNAFYIVSPEGKSLTVLYERATNGQDLVLEDFHKKENQVWFFRKNIQYVHGLQSAQQQYEEQLSNSLSKIMSKSPIAETNQLIKLKEMKSQMASRNMALPSWLSKPRVRDYEIEKLAMEDSVNQQQYADLSVEIQSSSTRSVGYLLNYVLKLINSITSLFSFKPYAVSMQCASNHTVAYIWYGSKQMPTQYKALLAKCSNNSLLLTEKDFQIYVKRWNQLQPAYSISIDDCPIRQRINLLKLLYLYFQSGIYADFDTEINQPCFANLFSHEIIFTNRMDQNLNYDMVFQVEQIAIPEENFMMVRNKFNPQVKRMLQQEIMELNWRGGQRWRECTYRQCLIVQCQKHYRDNTYKKGFD